jgi:hypothetical protein
VGDMDISPLAKRLAEENNVDWRTLRGSGESGKIVERDVLEYLARVMAGEEDLNPTPEPLPDGMAAWGDEGRDPASGTARWGGDAASEPSGSDWGGGNDDMLDTDSVEQDSSDASGGTDDWSNAGWGGPQSGASYEPPAGGTGAEAPGDSSEPDIDEGIFVFDDETDSDAAGAGASEGGEGSWAARDASGTGVDSLDDGFSWTDDESGQTEDSGPSGDRYGDGSGSASAPSDGFDSPGTGGEEQVEDDFFSLREEESTPPTSTPESFSWSQEPEAEPADSPWQATPEQPGDDRRTTGPSREEPAESADPGFGAEPEDEAPWGGGIPGEDSTAQATGHGFEEAAEDAPVESARANEAPAETWADEARVEPMYGEQQESEQPEDDTPWGGVPAKLATADEAIGASYQEPPATSHPHLGAAEVLPEGVSIEEEEIRVPADVGGAGKRAAEPRPPVAPPSTQPAAAPRTPAVSGAQAGHTMAGLGIVLRRDVDLGALVQAQQAVASELGTKGSMSAASFLVRAAARAGKPWPLTSPAALVGLASLDDEGIGVSAMARAAEMPFRELMAECRSAREAGDAQEVALVVADLSELGIDEAVLNLGKPVLTLGRILPRESGGFHGSLTLSGPIAPDAGSRFLARVVELLAAPVRLVL